MDGLIRTERWEFEDVFCADDSLLEVVDCIVYYVTGYLSRNIKMFKCAVCKSSLSVISSSISEAALMHCKTRGGIVHPNARLFNLLKVAEKFFSCHKDDYDVF